MKNTRLPAMIVVAVFTLIPTWTQLHADVDIESQILGGFGIKSDIKNLQDPMKEWGKIFAKADQRESKSINLQNPSDTIKKALSNRLRKIGQKLIKNNKKAPKKGETPEEQKKREEKLTLGRLIKDRADKINLVSQVTAEDLARILFGIDENGEPHEDEAKIEFAKAIEEMVKDAKKDTKDIDEDAFKKELFVAMGGNLKGPKDDDGGDDKNTGGKDKEEDHEGRGGPVDDKDRRESDGENTAINLRAEDIHKNFIADKDKKKYTVEQIAQQLKKMIPTKEMTKSPTGSDLRDLFAAGEKIVNWVDPGKSTAFQSYIKENKDGFFAPKGGKNNEYQKTAAEILDQRVQARNNDKTGAGGLREQAYTGDNDDIKRVAAEREMLERTKAKEGVHRDLRDQFGNIRQELAAEYATEYNNLKDGKKDFDRGKLLGELASSKQTKGIKDLIKSLEGKDDPYSKDMKRSLEIVRDLREDKKIETKDKAFDKGALEIAKQTYVCNVYRHKLVNNVSAAKTKAERDKARTLLRSDGFTVTSDQADGILKSNKDGKSVGCKGIDIENAMDYIADREAAGDKETATKWALAFADEDKDGNVTLGLGTKDLRVKRSGDTNENQNPQLRFGTAKGDEGYDKDLFGKAASLVSAFNRKGVVDDKGTQLVKVDNGKGFQTVVSQKDPSKFFHDKKDPAFYYVSKDDKLKGGAKTYNPKWEVKTDDKVKFEPVAKLWWPTEKEPEPKPEEKDDKDKTDTGKKDTEDKDDKDVSEAQKQLNEAQTQLASVFSATKRNACARCHDPGKRKNAIFDSSGLKTAEDILNKLKSMNDTKNDIETRDKMLGYLTQAKEISEKQEEAILKWLNQKKP